MHNVFAQIELDDDDGDTTVQWDFDVKYVYQHELIIWKWLIVVAFI